MRRLLITLFCLLLLVTTSLPFISDTNAEEALVLLNVPYRTQFDGSDWGPDNCGPATLGMVLTGFGEKVTTQSIRDRANRLLGVHTLGTGTRMQDLVRIAADEGLVANGPFAGDGPSFRRWTLADVRREVLARRPVIPQVYFPLLPNHRGGAKVDHYIAIVGLAGDDFIYNDSADKDGPGHFIRMSASEFSRAWGASDFPFAAFSLSRLDGGAQPEVIRDEPRIDWLMEVAQARYRLVLAATPNGPVAH